MEGFDSVGVRTAECGAAHSPRISLLELADSRPENRTIQDLFAGIVLGIPDAQALCTTRGNSEAARDWGAGLVGRVTDGRRQSENS